MTSAQDTHYIGDYGIQCNIESATQELDPWAYLPEEYTDDPDGIFDLCLSYYCVKGYVVARQRFLSNKCAGPIDEAGWSLYNEQASIRARSPTARPNTVSSVVEAAESGTSSEQNLAGTPTQPPFGVAVTDSLALSESTAQSASSRLMNVRSPLTTFGRQATLAERLVGEQRDEHSRGVAGLPIDDSLAESEWTGEGQNARQSSFNRYDQSWIEWAIAKIRPASERVSTIDYIMFPLVLLSMVCTLAVLRELRRIKKSASYEMSTGTLHLST
jgi:hypothetical protein